MHTRKDYMNRACTHPEYYAQFVTPSLKAAVLSKFGLDALLASTDEHLNDVGTLKQWDQLFYLMPIDRLREAGDVNANTLSNGVCCAKAAARQIIKEHTA